MRIVVSFPPSGEHRIRYAAGLCESSIKRFDELELHEVSPPQKPFFGQLLTEASKGSGEWFGWINGDCQLLTKPSEIDLSDVDVYGLRRIELGTGEQCGGVDGYLIRKEFWESTLSKDIPELYVGATHVDWWLTRATQKYGRYKEGFWLAHIPHEKTESSIGNDEFGKNNLREFKSWANRHKVSRE
jgi:hypothetical protein